MRLFYLRKHMAEEEKKEESTQPAASLSAKATEDRPAPAKDVKEEKKPEEQPAPDAKPEDPSTSSGPDGKKEEPKKEAPQEDKPAASEKGQDDKAPGFPEVEPGMWVRVHQKIKEVNAKGEEKERVQVFEGRVIGRKGGNETGATITVHKDSFGIGVDKIFPVHMPSIQKIEILRKAKVRRAKLWYLLRGYKKKIKEEKVAG